MTLINQHASSSSTDNLQRVAVVDPAPAELLSLTGPPDVATPGEVEVPPLKEPPPRWQGVRDAVGWLSSTVVHMLIVIALGLWYLAPNDVEKPLTLITKISDLDGEGPIEELIAEEDLLEPEDPGATETDEFAEEDPFSEETDLELSPVQFAGNVKSPDELAHELVTSPVKAAGTNLAGRSPRARAELVRREGGTAESEEAVAIGLKWLIRHQNSDGSWSLDRFAEAGECRGQCSGGGIQCDVAATAMALLPLLGAGQTHKEGQYTAQVANALHWLIEQQDDDGGLIGNGSPHTYMYAHAQAALALSESYTLTQDEWLAAPAQKAMDFIIAAQNKNGGWRYTPGASDGDTSVFGWQMMALQSARIGMLLSVPDEVFERATKFLESVQTNSDGSEYAYLPYKSATVSMTAEALLCRQYMGWPQNHPGLSDGADLLARSLPNRGMPSIYFWYYATQVLHNQGGRNWEKWNSALRDRLIAMQETHGHEAGSWTPIGLGQVEAGGRIYMTSLALCTLEVYYRYLPIYRNDGVVGR